MTDNTLPEYDCDRESEDYQLRQHIAMFTLLAIAEQDIREGKTFTYEEIKAKLAAKKRARKSN